MPGLHAAHISTNLVHELGGGTVIDLTRPGGTLAPAPPPVTHPALVADARFILKPQL